MAVKHRISSVFYAVLAVPSCDLFSSILMSFYKHLLTVWLNTFDWKWSPRVSSQVKDFFFFKKLSLLPSVPFVYIVTHFLSVLKYFVKGIARAFKSVICS